ncbi:WD-40 repeat protein [Reticulomyxa filosa]|uniref:WD-40 repeat protein n=1 Tax=Reticulomyxa filosa TaxID=46433 RepID=X6LX76_RETFI|nr:WD-40 repeat protein [Reticulomyxa filosa]|eukprot:ETO05742.1 WD-40 repeat protein [Reticulomyxa filosa]
MVQFRRRLVYSLLDFRKHWTKYCRKLNVEASQRVEKMLEKKEQGLNKMENSALFFVLMNSKNVEEKALSRYCMYVMKSKLIILDQVYIEIDKKPGEKGELKRKTISINFLNKNLLNEYTSSFVSILIHLYKYINCQKNQKSEKEIKSIIQNWIRILNIKVGWIHDLSKIIIKHVMLFVLLLFLILQGHDNTIFSVRFSPEGRRIVSSSFDKTVRVWDVASGKQIQTFKGHIDNVLHAEFSPDGHNIVSCSQDNTIRLWDIESGKELMKLDCIDWVRSINFSPDGKYIISGIQDGTIYIWDINSGKEIQRLVFYSNPITDVQFSSNGQMILASSYGKRIAIWDVKSGEKVKEFIGHHGIVQCAKFFPDCQYVVSSSWDETIRIWDVKSEKELQILSGHANPLGDLPNYVNDVTYFPDGQTIDMKYKKLERNSHVRSVAVSPDADTIVSASDDGMIQIWK